MTAAGGTVHWCQTPEDARQVILSLCQEADAKTVTKSKSMIAEEMELNPFLEEHGIEPVETDLGEYVVQLAEERPSHIIAPAVHKTRDQVADLFHEKHTPLGRTRRLERVEELVEEAREVLRPRYLAADVGHYRRELPDRGDRLVRHRHQRGQRRPDPDPAAHAHRDRDAGEGGADAGGRDHDHARARALGDGQEFSTYTTVSTGPRRPDDADGPEAYHVVLLDNGRSRMLGSEFREVLRCIKCGACMNHCPVYGTVGGHAYGWVYPGPVGAVLTPNLIGLEEARHLPNASSFCGRCEEVCPMRIPLPGLMRKLREQEFERRLNPAAVRSGIGAWAWLARRPALYRCLTGLGIRVLGAMGRRRGRFTRLPLAGGWTAARDLPAPEGATFHALWRKGRRA